VVAEQATMNVKGVSARKMDSPFNHLDRAALIIMYRSPVISSHLERNKLSRSGDLSCPDTYSGMTYAGSAELLYES
jgi:hypothetical protein